MSNDEFQINQVDLRVESCTLKDLILLNSGGNLPKMGIKATIRIPEYQRPYVWKEKQVKKLLLDLVEYFDDKRTEKQGKEGEEYTYIISNLRKKTDFLTRMKQ